MAELRLRPTRPLGNAPTIDLSRGDSKTLGRSVQADIFIDEPSLSRRHATIAMASDGGVSIEDLGSTNGVYVNGARRRMSSLAPGDRVRFGFLEFALERIAPAANQPAIEQTMTRRRLDVTSSREADAAALSGLLATSRELMAFEDLPALLDRVLDRLQPILTPDRAAILLFDRATGALTARAVRPEGEYASLSDFASSTAVREAIRAREVLEVHDAALDVRLADAVSIARAGVRSALCVPLLGRSGPVGALYVDRLSLARRFTPDQMEYAAAFAAHAAAAIETAQLYDDRERYLRATLESFARAIDARDRYTAGHSQRVTAYTLVLARAAEVADETLETIRRAGMLHDIGKVGVPDGVLLKPGPLDPEERRLMEAHVTIGYDMLMPLPFLGDALPIIRGHHERWDGAGYPDRADGTNIHPYARLMTVADSFDAMTSVRPYRRALSADEAARRLRHDRGGQFAPEAVDLFDATEAEFRDIQVAALAKLDEE